MERFTYEERQAKLVVDRAKARVRKANKAARPRKVPPPRTSKPEGALRERRPRQRDNAYLAFIRRLPCLSCRRHGLAQACPTEAAHIRAGFSEPDWSYTGKAQKPDDVRSAPLCSDCHQHGPDAQHKANETAWWQRLNLYPPAVCARLRQAYEAAEDGAAVISEIAAWVTDRG